jgi:hypothetical protein
VRVALVAFDRSIEHLSIAVFYVPRWVGCILIVAFAIA